MNNVLPLTGPREQVNQITAFIDNSHIYGSAENETRSLWTKTGPAGRMHVSLATNGGELLPHSPEPTKDQCSKPDEGLYCFKAGTEAILNLFPCFIPLILKSPSRLLPSFFLFPSI